MATNLNPGADTTLVNVAYRAAMANTPSDYSGTLERAADSYSKTMQASAKMWGDVAKVGASIGSDMIANAREFTNYAAMAGGLDSEGVTFLQDEVYSIKDEINALGVFNGTFGDRETKQKKAELKIKQAQLFADIDLAAASIKEGADAVGAGTFDVSLAMEDAEIVNAIIKSNLKNKVTNENNIARLSRNEETGELMYTMYDVSNNPDGEETGQTMTLKEFNNSIATNVKDGGAKAQEFNEYNNKIGDRGQKSKTGVYDEQMRAVDSNWIETQLQSPIDLKRALHMKFGYSDTSIFDDITKNEGEYSASLYRDLLSVTGGKDGLTGDIVDGIVDEGNPGINEVELQNSENYKILTGNLLGLKDPDVTKAYFKDYALKEFEKANNYGHSNKVPVAGSGASTTDQFFLGKQYVPAAAVTPDVNILNEDPNDIPARTAWNNTIFRKIDGQYQQYQDDKFVNVTKEALRVGLEFSDKVGYNMSSASTTPEITAPEVPEDFDKAFRDDDKKVVQFFVDNPTLYPGMKVKKTTSDDSGNKSDGFRVTMSNGTSKVFQADPLFGDKEKIQTVWDWINSNYVNNEFAE